MSSRLKTNSALENNPVYDVASVRGHTYIKCIADKDTLKAVHCACSNMRTRE